MWNTWKEARAGAGSSPWLRESDGVESAVRELSVFMACRCFGHKNQSQTIRGYLSAVKYFHKMHAGWELPTSHFQILAMLKTIDRVHANTQTKPKVRNPLSWDMLEAGKCVVENSGESGKLIWCGLALSYLLMCRASEIWADDSGLVHSDFCLTRGEADQKRLGATVTRSGEALKVLLDLLDLHPELGSHAPLMQSWAQDRWKVISRAEASRHLRLLVRVAGRDPQKYALHSGRIGGATHLASMGASVIQIQRAGRWKSSAFMVYVRAGGEGAKFVSQALTEPEE